MAHMISYAFTFCSLSTFPDLASNCCFTGRLDQIWTAEGALPWESRAKKMNTSISVSSRHIKAEYHWGKKAMRCIVKFKEDVIAK